ncbi:MAG: hypothetical protein NC092_04380 [Butyrivibrio sp.]|nr:hypothetical protein [Muribaculum sp.]MCM1551913.1 hypothetical protein [Butyrivibrio sp.]
MKMKLKKCILAVVVSCFTLVNVSALQVHAATNVRETEPNDTRENATEITANRETPAQAVSGSRPNQYVVHGSTKAGDDDWFRVYLNAGTQYVTLNGDSYYSFDVYTEFGTNPIISDEFVRGEFGSKAFSFSASTAGYYYVKIYTDMSSTRDYIMLVGDPTYTVASCYVELGNVSMQGSDRVIPIDLRGETAIPEDAIVYSMTVNNVRSTAVKGITVRNRTTSNTINLNSSTWSKDGLVSLSMPVRSNWQVTFEYSKNTTFTPTVRLQFVYPVTSEYLEDDITIGL